MNDSRNKNDAGIIQSPVGITDDVLLFENCLDGFTSTLLTIPEVATLLKISITGVRRLQEQRKIPFIKVGGSVRFLKEDLISYLQKQRVETVG